MVIDNLIVFDDDFPEGLVEELNSSYENSRAGRLHADERPARSVNSSTQQTRLQDEPWSSQSYLSRKNALLSSDSAAGDRSGDDTTFAKPQHAGPSRPSTLTADTQQRQQQHSLVSTPRMASSRASGETFAESRGSPGGGKSTRRYMLQRDQLPGSRFPFNATAPLARLQAGTREMRGDPLKAQANASPGAVGDVGIANSGKTDVTGNVPPRNTGNDSTSLPRRTGSDPDGQEGVKTAGGGGVTPSQHYPHPSQASDVRPTKHKDLGNAAVQTGYNIPVIVLLICIAIGMGFAFHQQSVQNQRVTMSLESRIAELHELINLYATSQPHSEDAQEAAITEAPRPYDDDTSTRSDPATAAVEVAGPSSSNLALLSAGAHILTGYTTPPASFGWWRWSQNFRVDHNCMLRATSSECWPIQKDATIGIGLGQTASVEQVRLDFAGIREPFNFEAYLIHANGAIESLAHNASGPDFKLVGASNVTQLMLRLSGFGDLCVKRVEIIGNVT